MITDCLQDAYTGLHDVDDAHAVHTRLQVTVLKYFFQHLLYV